jgi:uncharacterized membrane protein
MFSPGKICTSQKVFFAAVVVFAAVRFARAGDTSLELLTLDFPSARATVAYGISAHGDVVGTYVDQNGTNHGFRLTAGQYVSIDPAGSLFTEARGINAKGDIVGDYVASDGNLHGFLLGPDGYKDISVAGHLNTIPTRISSEGVIVGCYHDTDTMGTMHGWVRNEDGLIVYSTPASMHNGITPRGDVGGFFTDLMTMQTHGYILSKGATTQVDFPGSTATRVWDLNSRREAVGFYLDPTTHVFRGFQYRKGQVTPIDIPSAKSTRPFGINSQGDIVGAYVDQNGKTRGFLLSRGEQARKEEEREDE